MEGVGCAVCCKMGGNGSAQAERPAAGERGLMLRTRGKALSRRRAGNAREQALGIRVPGVATEPARETPSLATSRGTRGINARRPRGKVVEHFRASSLSGGPGKRTMNSKRSLDGRKTSKSLIILRYRRGRTRQGRGRAAQESDQQLATSGCNAELCYERKGRRSQLHDVRLAAASSAHCCGSHLPLDVPGIRAPWGDW